MSLLLLSLQALALVWDCPSISHYPPYCGQVFREANGGCVGAYMGDVVGTRAYVMTCEVGCAEYKEPVQIDVVYTYPGKKFKKKIHKAMSVRGVQKPHEVAIPEAQFQAIIENCEGIRKQAQRCSKGDVESSQCLVLADRRILKRKIESYNRAKEVLNPVLAQVPKTESKVLDEPVEPLLTTPLAGGHLNRLELMSGTELAQVQAIEVMSPSVPKNFPIPVSLPGVQAEPPCDASFYQGYGEGYHQGLAPPKEMGLVNLHLLSKVPGAGSEPTVEEKALLRRFLSTLEGMKKLHFLKQKNIPLGEGVSMELPTLVNAELGAIPFLYTKLGPQGTGLGRTTRQGFILWDDSGERVSLGFEFGERGVSQGVRCVAPTPGENACRMPVEEVLGFETLQSVLRRL